MMKDYHKNKLHVKHIRYYLLILSLQLSDKCCYSQTRLEECKHIAKVRKAPGFQTENLFLSEDESEDESEYESKHEGEYENESENKST